MLEDVIEEEFTIYEGLVTFDPHREDVEICIETEHMRYYGKFRYYTFYSDGINDGKLISFTENDEPISLPFRLPKDNSHEDFYLERIVGFGRRAYPSGF